jgi:hypothetical protein
MNKDEIIIKTLNPQLKKENLYFLLFLPTYFWRKYMRTKREKGK